MNLFLTEQTKGLCSEFNIKAIFLKTNKNSAIDLLNIIENNVDK